MKYLLSAAVIAVASLTLAACDPAKLASLDFGVLEEIGIDPAAAIEKAEKVETATLGNAAKAMPVYCKAPDLARSTLRERFNSRPETGGAQFGVWCPGDPPLTLGQ